MSRALRKCDCPGKVLLVLLAAFVLFLFLTALYETPLYYVIIAGGFLYVICQGVAD